MSNSQSGLESTKCDLVEKSWQAVDYVGSIVLGWQGKKRKGSRHKSCRIFHRREYSTRGLILSVIENLLNNQDSVCVCVTIKI